jgi:lipid A 3-O-deacylase
MRVPIVSNTRMARHGFSKSLLPILLFLAAFDTWAQNLPSPKAPHPDQSISFSTNETSLSELRFNPASAGIWENGVGEGFRSTVKTFSIEPGVALGMKIFGSRQAHDLALISLSYGHMLGPVIGEGHWYCGNPELRIELFAGGEYSPESESFVGLTPHLRYNFATGTRWIPFFDLGAGVSATSIGPPDLSGTFEFNLQLGGGVHWFLRDNLALTSEVKYLHMSCAGIHPPNLGLNSVAWMIGVTWFF